MGSYLRHAVAWAPAGKAVFLFLLSAPLLLATLAALISGKLASVALTCGGLASLWGAATLAGRSLAAEARYLLGERIDLPATPLKLISAALTAIGVSLAAIAGGYNAGVTLVFALLAICGHLAFFGRDLSPVAIHVADVEGVDSAAVTLQLRQAYARLRGIEAATRQIGVPDFRDRLLRISNIGRSILAAIEQHPADAARARRFLNLYLESAEHVTAEYARTRGHGGSQPLDQNFRQLLGDMENTFAEQHRKLIDRDLLSLDVDIEVLNAQLKREGLG